MCTRPRQAGHIRMARSLPSIGIVPGRWLRLDSVTLLLNGGSVTAPIVLASSALAVVLVLALVREVRLRRALQVLLRRLLDKWRKDTHD